MALRFQSNTHDFTDVPIPTTRIPAHSNPTLRRAKTLTRPERGVAPTPLLNPQQSATHRPGAGPDDDVYPGSALWRISTQIMTCWAPGFLLSSLGGMKDKSTQQAWREKVSLCIIIAVMGLIVGFATVGLQKALCPQTAGTSDADFQRLGSTQGTLGVQGRVFNVSNSKSTPDTNFITLSKIGGIDITNLFTRTAANYNKCNGLKFRVAQDDPCSSLTPCPLPSITLKQTFTDLGFVQTALTVGFDWTQVAKLKNHFVIDGAVLNMTGYMQLHPNPVPGDIVDAALRTILQGSQQGSGKDGTRLFFNRADLKAAVPCLQQRYYAGNIDKIPPGCFVSQLFLYVSLIVILGLVFVRFVMACVFNWFLSERLAGPPERAHLARSAISPAVMPEGANVSIDNKHGTAPWAGPDGHKRLAKGKSMRSVASSSATLVNSGSDVSVAPVMTLDRIGRELFAVCLVTCYSEGEDSLRTTLDSISTTDYSDHRKLLFVVADGMITGAGEKRSTPDVCVSLLEADPRFGNPIPMRYNAVGSGAKAHNRAMVYAGHYSMSLSPTLQQEV
jgi:chitin synthase